MKFFGDYHIHTTYSDGRSSVEEMVEAASLAGLKELGLADHGPRNLGSGVKSEQVLLHIKDELNLSKEQYPEMKLYAGVEANVVSLMGDLDISREVIKQLDFLIAGLHPYVLPKKLKELPWVLKNNLFNVSSNWVSSGWSRGKSGGKRRIINDNTKALVEAIYRYEIDVISHPGLKMEIDLAETAKACLARDTCWEINTGHQHPGYQEVLEVARWGVNFMVNSDAHFPESVGALDYGSWVLEKAGVPLQQIKNAGEEVTDIL